MHIRFYLYFIVDVFAYVSSLQVATVNGPMVQALYFILQQIEILCK